MTIGEKRTGCPHGAVNAPCFLCDRFESDQETLKNAKEISAENDRLRTALTTERQRADAAEARAKDAEERAEAYREELLFEAHRVEEAKAETLESDDAINSAKGVAEEHGFDASRPANSLADWLRDRLPHADTAEATRDAVWAELRQRGLTAGDEIDEQEPEPDLAAIVASVCARADSEHEARVGAEGVLRRIADEGCVIDEEHGPACVDDPGTAPDDYCPGCYARTHLPAPQGGAEKGAEER